MAGADSWLQRDKVLPALIVAAFAGMCWLFWGCFADDAFIVARYAANVLRGNGLVFNVGERVDALTSPMGLLALLPFQALFGDAIRAYAVACAVAVAAVTLWTAARVFRDPARRRLFLCCVLIFPPFGYWTIGGLETPILSAIVLALAAIWYSRHVGVAVPVLFLSAAAVLTRYDAVLLVAPLALHVLVRERASARTWLAAALAGAAVLGWLGGAYAWFGDVLPTSFYTKNPTVWTGAGLGRGALYEVSLLVLFGIPLLLGLRSGRVRKDAADHASARVDWPLVLGLALYFAYGLTAGISHMMYAYRLFVPCLPWIGVLVILRMRAAPAAYVSIAIVGLQLAFALLIYFKALNFNLSLLVSNQTPFHESFEFSTVGAIVAKRTNATFAQQAAEIRALWRRQPAAAGAEPRLHSITEGQPPYQLQDYYVFGPLVGYRRDCHADTIASSNYLQHFGWVDENGVELAAWNAPGWELVASDDVPVRDWHGTLRNLRIQWFFQRQPLPNPLPPTVAGTCVA
jgi:hypothetical protein